MLIILYKMHLAMYIIITYVLIIYIRFVSPCKITTICIIMECFWCLLPLLLQLTTANIYYIQPTNYNLSTQNTLQGYINDTRNSVHNYNYCSNNELILLPGKHFLQTDFIIQNACNFAMHGNNSKIYCGKPFLGISLINVTNVVLSNVDIINCGKSYILRSDSKVAANGTAAVHFNKCTYTYECICNFYNSPVRSKWNNCNKHRCL